MKIVFDSNTGHTEEYAKMLAEKLNMQCINIKKYKKDKESIIYLGWVFASNIQGYKKIKKVSKIECLIAVGMNPVTDKNIKQLKEVNNIEEKFFYLQGGVDYSKLKGIKKMMFKMVTDSVINENKPEDKDIIEVLKSGKSLVEEKNLEEIIKYVKEKENNK